MPSAAGGFAKQRPAPAQVQLACQAWAITHKHRATSSSSMKAWKLCPAFADLCTHLHDQPLLLRHRRPHSIQLPVQPPPHLPSRDSRGEGGSSAWDGPSRVSWPRACPKCGRKHSTRACNTDTGMQHTQGVQGPPSPAPSSAEPLRASQLPLPPLGMAAAPHPLAPARPLQQLPLQPPLAAPAAAAARAPRVAAALVW